MLVDLAWAYWDWFLTVLRNLTGIELPSFLDIGTTLKGHVARTGHGRRCNWLASPRSGMRCAIGSLLRGLTRAG